MTGVPSSLALPAPPRSLVPALAAARESPSAGLLVTIPVFLQAPWVHHAPFSACLFTAVLLAAGILLERRPGQRGLGQLLVGFSGSWLAGSLFWGWCRIHPLWHLPIEAFALPLALAGLASRWRLASAFYLASLLGTAVTDGAMAAAGLMPFWPQVLSAAPAAASGLLRQAATQVFTPLPLLLVVAMALVLLQVCRWLWLQGPCGRVAATALGTTLAVDGLFLASALVAPAWSGLL